MRILSMTATFGNLEQQTLTLEPGLNVIQAPNEWGKSTWCAFITAMLYGVETRAKTTKTALADKERYLPWSGSPMSGRMDIVWKGRCITIERQTRGRIPMGQFLAYETDSGIPIPELTSGNCGQILLGVEKSVFLRGGFIRLKDMPLSQDEALRARLNALVTTGDEGGDGQRLARELKELKNRCRYNQSGLLPQAQGERNALTEKLRELDALKIQSEKLSQRHEEVTQWLQTLENHNAHLRYQRSRQDAQRLTRAEQEYADAQTRLNRARADCVGCIPRDEAEQKLLRLRDLEQQALDLQMEARMMPQPPESPEPPEPFRGMDGAQAVTQAQQDGQSYQALRPNGLLPILAAVLAVAGALLCLWRWIPAGILVTLGAVALVLSWMDRKKIAARRGQLMEKYGSDDPQRWLQLAQHWQKAEQEARNRLDTYRKNHADLLDRYETLRRRIGELTQGQEQARELWERSIANWDALSQARKQQERAEQYRQTVSAMAVQVAAPEGEDSLTYSDTETARLISDARGELQQLSQRLNQYRGRMEALGDPEAMTRELEKLNRRIADLEDTHAALTIALDTLNQATLTLQRRFAPQIARRAQSLMAAMTAGRYDRLHLGEDLALRSGAGGENTLHDALWRSDGTIDQLYLSLRLALAENLTPEAPLVLDDALVRFDDARLGAAMGLLEQEARSKQVIIFTCQSREKAFVENDKEKSPNIPGEKAE